MELGEMRAIYDYDQRIEVEYPGSRREVFPDLVRSIGETRPHSTVMYSRINPLDLSSRIDGEIAFFRSLGHTFEWKVYDYDTPPDLTEQLVAHGMVVEDTGAVMVLDLDDAPASLFGVVKPEVHRIDDPARIPEILSVQRQVWGRDFKWLEEELASTRQETPDRLSIYAAYMDDQPVSSCWVRFPPNSKFSSLWGGSTLEAYRGRGLFSALLAARVQETRSRGRRFVTVDASEMSRPILEKFGFRTIGYATECYWAGDVT